MKSLIKSFWERVRPSVGNECWLWAGAKSDKGYGTLQRSAGGVRVNYYAHRMSWEIHFGEIPAGLEVCHRCDVPLCVRPDHLFLGTHADNMRDMAAKGRSALGERSRAFTHPETYTRGERHHGAKLTDAQCAEIRARAIPGRGGNLRKLAAEFGVAKRTIARLKAGTYTR